MRQPSSPKAAHFKPHKTQLTADKNSRVMAGALFEAGKALVVSVSATPGGPFSINISTDYVQVAKEVCRTVTTLGALYFGYKLMKPLIEGAVNKGLGGERDDQEVRGIRPGSLHVQLHCFTDERFLEVLAEYETGKMKERLQKEFSQVGIKVEGLKVEIENMEEVNEIKEAINKRYDRFFMKNISRPVCTALNLNEKTSH